MNGISLVITIVLLAGGVSAQTKEEKKAAKKAKKEAQSQQQKDDTAVLISLVESQQFVLEANTLYDKTGQSYILSSNLNFVGFDGKNSTIQLALQQLVGWNGVGGVALDGKITKMKIKPDAKGIGFSINAVVQNKGGGGITMIFRVNSTGSARVDMNGNFGERISFQGNIYSLEKTSVYKATPLF